MIFFRYCGAWFVHILTASGLVFGFMALIALVEDNVGHAFLFLTLAICIDAIDGTLARHLDVKRYASHINGELLDNIVDFNNYTFVPLVFLYTRELVHASILPWAVTAVLFASAYQFCHSEAKTEDNFFRGFPSYWIILFPYLYWLKLSPLSNSLIIFLLVALSFSPLLFIYISRAPRYGMILWPLGIIHCLSVLYHLLYNPENPGLDLFWTAFLFWFFYVILSMMENIRLWREKRV